jgi:hypothetical protein
MQIIRNSKTLGGLLLFKSFLDNNVGVEDIDEVFVLYGKSFYLLEALKVLPDNWGNRGDIAIIDYRGVLGFFFIV